MALPVVFATLPTGANPLSLFDTNFNYLENGKMAKSVYDPGNIGANAFSQDNMVSGGTNVNFTAVQSAKLAGLTQVQPALAAGATVAPVNADKFVILDALNGLAIANVTWSGIIAALTTIFNALYIGQTFASLTGKPTTLSGYGITDANLDFLNVAVSDEITPIVVGNSKVTFRMPRAMTLRNAPLGVRASLTTAQTSGSFVTVDIKQNGASILGTKITFNNAAKTSVGATTPATIVTMALTDDSEITIDITQIGDGTATGLKIALIGQL